jgi:hypothetical protein
VLLIEFGPEEGGDAVAAAEARRWREGEIDQESQTLRLGQDRAYFLPITVPEI